MLIRWCVLMQSSLKSYFDVAQPFVACRSIVFHRYEKQYFSGWFQVNHLLDLGTLCLCPEVGKQHVVFMSHVCSSGGLGIFDGVSTLIQLSPAQEFNLDSKQMKGRLVGLGHWILFWCLDSFLRFSWFSVSNFACPCVPLGCERRWRCFLSWSESCLPLRLG